MPAFANRVHGTSYSKAYLEAMSVAPIERAMLYCVSLEHPAMTEPVHIVRNFENIVATLESSAAGAPGETVEFIALPIGMKLPEESDQSMAPSVSIWLDGVSETVATELDNVVETLDPVTLTVRAYASDDLTGPANDPPLQLEVINVKLDETRVSLQATFTDPVNESFPGKSYTREEYPGLSL